MQNYHPHIDQDQGCQIRQVLINGKSVLRCIREDAHQCITNQNEEAGSDILNFSIQRSSEQNMIKNCCQDFWARNWKWML